MNTVTTATPSIVWHELAAYNSGRLVSKRFELDDYSDYAEYMEALNHWLESVGGEEYILCDYEDVPRQYISEWGLDREFFEFQEKTNELGWEMCVAALTFDIPLDKIEEAYRGQYESMEDYAYELMNDCYDLDGMPSILTCHIDWAGVARDLSFETNFENGFVFSCNW